MGDISSKVQFKFSQIKQHSLHNTSLNFKIKSVRLTQTCERSTSNKESENKF